MKLGDDPPDPLAWDASNGLRDLGSDVGGPLPDLLRLWQVCDRAGCRRSRHCRGDISACYAGKKKLTTPHVRAWYAHMEAAERPDCEPPAKLTNPEALEAAAIAWRAALRAAEAWEKRRRGGAKPT
jgi:hypothetical protein